MTNLSAHVPHSSFPVLPELSIMKRHSKRHTIISAFQNRRTNPRAWPLGRLCSFPGADDAEFFDLHLVAAQDFLAVSTVWEALVRTPSTTKEALQWHKLNNIKYVLQDLSGSTMWTTTCGMVSSVLGSTKTASQLMFHLTPSTPASMFFDTQASL